MDFLLYTKSNRGAPQKISVTNLGSRFITGGKTFILIHGFTDKGYSSWIQSMKNELLNLHFPMNVIIVNWQIGAGKSYSQSAANTRTVGTKTGSLIKAIKDKKRVPYSKFHIIGHSLGAHAAGFSGKQVLKIGRDKVGRISGLDPAGFKFARSSEKNRLSPKDADFVDVIHTNDGTFLRLAFGYLTGRTLGHVDFYPNGGKRQPGCPNPISFNFSTGFKSVLACSHNRSTAYFINSIRRCQYKSYRCPKGTPSSSVRMGFHASSRLRGKYCLSTNSKQPFC